MLMFDPVPVKQEAMDPVSVVSFPKLNAFYLFQVVITLLCAVLLLKVTHRLTHLIGKLFSNTLVKSERNTLKATVHHLINGIHVSLRPATHIPPGYDQHRTWATGKPPHNRSRFTFLSYQFFILVSGDYWFWQKTFGHTDF